MQNDFTEIEEPKGLKLYLVSQDERTGYDTIDSFVCSAISADVARNFHPGSILLTHKNWEDLKNWEDYDAWASSPEKVKVQLLGIRTGYQGRNTELILKSFNAG